MAKKTKFSQESQAANPEAEANTTATEATGPSPAMLAMFAARNVDKKKLNRLNLPTMISPKFIPVGGVITGKILGILDSPVSTIKGKLLHLETEQGEYSFPVTGAIRSALAPGVKDDDVKLRGALEKFIGQYIYAERGMNKPSKFGRDLFTFEVYTSKTQV